MGGSRKGVIRQLTGSFLSFAFIWQWHGGHLYALWWFIPNWLGVVVESAAGKVLAQPSVRRMEVGVRDRSLFIVWGGGGGAGRGILEGITRRLGEQRGGSVVTENPKGGITGNFGRIQSGDHSNLLRK